MYGNHWATHEEGAVGGEPVETQEEGDNRTMEDLLVEIREKDQRLGVQQREIENLKSQLNLVMNHMKMFSIQSGSPMSPTTCTVTTTEPRTTQSKVVFSSAWSQPVFTQPTGLWTNPNLGIPGVSPQSNKGRKPSTTPDLVHLDDSSESETGSSSSSSVGLHKQSQDLSSVVQLMGRQSCPRPEVYSFESGRSFSRFLQSFEAYCEGKYSSAHKDLWTSELGRFLEGEIKQVYDAWGGPEKKYRKMKGHLESWHAGVKERITSSRRSQYRHAKMLPNENLQIFATRLENLHKMAYPHQELDGKDLKRQLVSAIPASAAETLERDLALVRATTGRQNTWGDVLRLLEIQDEALRRGSVTSTQVTVPNPSQTWAGAIPKNWAMRVETGSKSRRGNHVPRDMSRSPQRKFKSPGRRHCNWCKRPGHEYKNCRRRLNQCLRCGSENHRVSVCPEPVQRSRQRSRSASTSAGSESGQRRGRSSHYQEMRSQGTNRKKSSKREENRSSSSSQEREWTRNQQRRQPQNATGRPTEKKNRSSSSSYERSLNRDSLV